MGNIKGGYAMKTFNAVEQENFNVRNVFDRRKRENNLIVSYKDEMGIEYRKRFCFPVLTTFDEMIKQVPKTI